MKIHLFKQNKWFKRALGSALGLLLVWALAWLALPPLLKNQLEKLASEQLGRQVTLGALEFKPWSLELTVHDLAVARSAGAADGSPQLHIQRIYIDAELQSLLRLAPVLDALEVQAPHLSVTHLGAGHYDVDDMLARLSQAPEQPAGAPLGFALYNLALSGGSVDFIDQPVGKTHTLRDLQIKLPFLSNFPSQRAVLVQPQLAFRLNGSAFDASAQGTPFAQTHKTDASFKLSKLDLAPYLSYVPASLPLRLKSAVLDADLKLAFEQSPESVVKLSGTLQASQVSLVRADAPSHGWLDFDQLKLTLSDVRPLARVAQLAAVELSGPHLRVQRNKAGQLNLALPSKPPVAPEKIAAHAGSTGATGLNDAKTKDWKLGIAKLAVHSGSLDWVDERTAPTARFGLRDVALNASGIAWPLTQPVPFDGAAQLTTGASAQPGHGARLSVQGSATDLAAHLTASLANLPLSAAAPYLAQFMTPQLAGTLQAELGLNWQASADATQPDQWQLEARQLTLDGLDLTLDKTSLASVKKLQIEGAQLDLARQSATIGKLSVSQPQVAVRRERDGQWMVQSWLKPATAAPRQVAATQSKPWAMAVQDVALVGGAVKFVDKTTAKPVVFELSALSVALKNFSTKGKQAFGANVSTQIRTRASEAGRVQWQGNLGLSPLMAQGRVDASRVPLQAFEPYLADVLNIHLIRADASFKGQVNYAQSAAGPVLKLTGDTLVEELQANSLASTQEPVQVGQELLNWKLLSLRGLDVALAPHAATTVAVQETVLSDFFARLILSHDGRLNLQDMLKSAPPNTPELIAASATSTGATATNEAETALQPVINVGPVSLLGGRVHFSDHFIEPNYSTNLSDLTGKLSAFSSQARAGELNLADLELRGRAEGTASLEILGKINPLATPVALDIKGRVRDLELPPLSPYSVRYAGYGIERGKLSVDVAYQVLANGQLTASNNIVLNQLSFGDKVEGAPASLPVKLAVALLADRNGVIDINLPVSGSLNDPQFKLAPIVFKLIGNLIVKAITSPFSLLASAFWGGSDELSQVSFAPGSAELSADAKPGLDKVVKALTERPALRMTVVGSASLEVEREAYKREQLKALVQAEQRHATLLRGATLAEPTPYPILLKAVYRRADFPKPRNLVGLTKDLPVADMEALLLAHLPATEESMRELALARGVTVRDYLAAQQLPLERLFLGAAKALPAEAKWSPRAELNLTLP
jgi:hypothetical protein